MADQNVQKHYLITGGAGYIGSLLTSELLRHGHRVTVVDNLLFGGESLVSFFSHPNFHFAKYDVWEPRAIKASIRRDWPTPDGVIHLAAIPTPTRHTAEVVFRNNVMSTFNVFEAAEFEN